MKAYSSPKKEKSIQSLLHPHSPSRNIIHTRPQVENSSTSTEPPDQLLNTRNGCMPASFASLLALHHALENALLLHLSTQGANAAVSINSSTTQSSSASYSPNPPSRPVDQRMKTPEPEDYTPDNSDSLCPVKIFRFENLISWPLIQPIVERASGEKFSIHHLAQLLWLWQNDPEDLEAEQDNTQAAYPTSIGSSNSHKDSKSMSKEQVGMGFIISSVRALEGSKGFPNKKRIAYTYGLGIEIKARENQQLPTYSLESPGKSNQFLHSSPTRTKQVGRSPSNSSKSVFKAREIMSLVALWSSKSFDRKNEVARRLRSFWLIHSPPLTNPDIPHKVDQKNVIQIQVKPKLARNIKIPLGNLPSLNSINDLQDQIMLSPNSDTVKSSSKRKISHNVSSNFSSSDSSDDLEIIPSTTKRVKSTFVSPLHSKTLHPANHTSPLLAKSSQSKSSVQLRALHLLERIKAKEDQVSSSSSIHRNIHNSPDL